MAVRSLPRLFVAGALALLVLGASAERCRVDIGTLYVLEKGSAFERGCFPPCMCPALILDDLRGTFVLRPHPLAAPSLFDTYQVDVVRWRVGRGEQELEIRGSGSYEVGGEFALEQRLALDLQVGSEPVQRFDSGFVVPPADFPRIQARISVNGEYCFDTVFDVRAVPVLTF